VKFQNLPGILSGIIAGAFAVSLFMVGLGVPTVTVGFVGLLISTAVNRLSVRETKGEYTYSFMVQSRFNYLASRVAQTIIFGSVIFYPIYHSIQSILFGGN